MHFRPSFYYFELISRIKRALVKVVPLPQPPTEGYVRSQALGIKSG